MRQFEFWPLCAVCIDYAPNCQCNMYRYYLLASWKQTHSVFEGASFCLCGSLPPDWSQNSKGTRVCSVLSCFCLWNRLINPRCAFAPANVAPCYMHLFFPTVIFPDFVSICVVSNINLLSVWTHTGVRSPNIFRELSRTGAPFCWKESFVRVQTQMSLWMYPNQPRPAGRRIRDRRWTCWQDLAWEHHRVPRKSWMIWVGGRTAGLLCLTCCHHVTWSWISRKGWMVLTCFCHDSR